ncbi:pilus assembly protein PilM [bacterium]|nr:pilus assembly protein PilM [bacterium]
MPRAIAIELSEADAKVLQLRHQKKKGMRLERILRVSFEGIERGEEATEQRGARLRDALKSLRLSSAPISLVIPKQSTTVRKVHLPSTEPSEIASMAHFEAEKFIPFNVERHIIGHQVMETKGLEGSEVMLAAVDEEVMQQWYNVTHAAGLDPSFGDVSTLAQTYGFLAGSTEDDLKGTVALVNIGIVHTDITLLRDGEIVTTRSMMHGLQNLLRELGEAFHLDRPLHIEELKNLNVLEPDGFRLPTPAAPSVGTEDQPTDEELQVIGPGERENGTTNVGDRVRGWVQKLIINLQRTYEFALREFSVPSVERVCISGEGTILDGIEHALVLHLGVSVSFYNPLEKIERDAKAEIDPELLPAFAAVYGAARRLALEEEDSGINLLPQSVMEAQEQSERRFQLIISGTMVVIACVMGFLLYSAGAEHRTLKAERFEEDIDKINVVLSDVDDMRQRLDFLKGNYSDRSRAMDILEAISAYPQIGPQPRGRLTLDEFQFKLGDEVQIDGTAMSIEDINKFLVYLQKQENESGPLFTSADTRNQNTTTLPGRNQAVYQFQIVGRMD